MPQEQEDLNDFKMWDTVGATAFLAIVPAVMYWVFVGHDVIKVAGIGGIAVIASIVVLILSLLFPERIVGRIVNKIGTVLAPVYLLLAIWLFWLKWGGNDTPPPPQQAPTEQSAGESTAS